MFFDSKSDFDKHNIKIFDKIVNVPSYLQAPKFVTEIISSTNL